MAEEERVAVAERSMPAPFKMAWYLAEVLTEHRG